MTSRKKKWIAGGVVAVALTVTVMLIAAKRLSARFEPYIRDQAKQYLSTRFESEVEFGRLTIDIPRIPPLRLLFTEGRGVIAEVTGENIVMRHKGRRDIPPMFAIERLRFEIDLGRMFEPKTRVALVHLDRMRISIPPKGERPNLSDPGTRAPTAASPGVEKPPASPGAQTPSAFPSANDVLIERVIISDSLLVILPRLKTRQPLDFELRRVALDSVQWSEALQYEADLTNPKPPGTVKAKGTFGPWNADSPSDSPLTGEYDFINANLGVFRAIAGTLNSKGRFGGTLNEIEAKGEVAVPNFRLTMAGNSLPLHATFEALIDGTNGNTVLKPVRAKLNSTSFTTSGAVIKHDRDTRRSIDLQVNMPDGNLLDLLRLAMKAEPPMSARIQLNAKISIPPLQGRVAEKLILDGRFKLKRGHFLRALVQDKVDSLSRRGQGQPKNETIDNVFSDMAGTFHLEDEKITFEGLSFRVPGAGVELAGLYDLDADLVDFKGALKLDAKVSQTMTGWKRWLLKPVDPILARKGAGTYLKIKVTGTSKNPSFGASR